MDIKDINSFQADVLKEIGNIGSGNAATALSCMLNKKVDMKVPEVKIVEINKVGDMLGGAEAPVAGLLLRMTGDIGGYIMFILGLKEASTLVNIIMGKQSDDNNYEALPAAALFDEMEKSALKEIGNILAGSYISAIASLVNLRILPDVPALAVDMAGAVLSVPAIEFGRISDSVLFIETVFIEGSMHVTGNLFLIPELNSYETLLNALGVIC